MEGKQTAIVLGGTAPHIALLENLKDRGYYTVLIDYYENPFAKQIADQHLQESTLDKEKVLQIAIELEAKLVISTSIDQANITACYVSEKLGLSLPYSYETSLKVTDKGTMKGIMKRYGIPTSKHVLVGCYSDFENSDLSFPIVVKPADATGSKGVRKASNIQQVKKYLQEAIVISRSKKAVIEEYNLGVEVQADFFIQKGIPHLIMLREKNRLVLKEDAVLQSIGSTIPVHLSQEAIVKIKHVADQLTSVFNLDTTSLFVQLNVNGNDIKVIEFACRIGGGLSYKMIKLITGFDILDATIDSFLGNPVVINSLPPDFFYATRLIYTFGGMLGRIQGHEQLVSDGVIEEFFVLKKKNAEIGTDLSSQNRVGAFIVRADSKEELTSKINSAISTLEVIDLQGNNVMRKDVYSENISISEPNYSLRK
ncbi:ATP-grasp domain-containing protein [Algoriphagus sp. NG3]|uniref:ATP-grasp domain-containing protein n=1 Tax=Algoriphagus sp. NG3 TaxID=3097546 RepID=UPI002A831137|nr:ATP-grasp domain-containing protein [Algoriphagus sp. NG3]WPR77833.1 ATP-grasp domain-containing protein [Algoriphagus sp. NG3]